MNVVPSKAVIEEVALELGIDSFSDSQKTLTFG